MTFLIMRGMWKRKRMARFVKHTSCPKCGSRDNLGVYDDGSEYCFGCGHTTPRNAGRFNRPYVTQGEEHTPFLRRRPQEVREDVSRFLLRYEIQIRECSRRNVFWDNVQEQLVFQLFNREGEVVCEQARNFNPQRARRAKYYNRGRKEEAFPLYTVEQGQHTNRIVITEDALSSLKIARKTDAMPALGVTLPKSHLIALKGLGYTDVVVWLDKDKWREARLIADRFKNIGLSTSTRLTEKDPKEYTDEEIKKILEEL
jgi:Zn ribbon nucleic-acid-binding protein